MKTMWKQQTIDFGIVEKKKTLTAEFEYTGTKKIKAVHPSCGCTTSAFTENTVTLKYTSPDKVPNYLRDQGSSSYTVTKSATVTFDDKSKEVINISCTINL